MSQGKKYILRVINTSVDTTWIFSIDNHNFTVMSTDFVPIHPYEVDHIVLGIGKHSTFPTHYLTNKNQASAIISFLTPLLPTRLSSPPHQMATTGSVLSAQIDARLLSLVMNLMNDRVFFDITLLVLWFLQRLDQLIPRRVVMRTMTCSNPSFLGRWSQLS